MLPKPVWLLIGLLLPTTSSQGMPVSSLLPPYVFSAPLPAFQTWQPKASDGDHSAMPISEQIASAYSHLSGFHLLPQLQFLLYYVPLDD